MVAPTSHIARQVTSSSRVDDVTSTMICGTLVIHVTCGSGYMETEHAEVEHTVQDENVTSKTWCGRIMLFIFFTAFSSRD